MTTIVVSHEDHENNLRLKACLLSYNLHVCFLFEMKKKKNTMRSQHTCQFFVEGKRQGERIFIETLFFTFKKRRFKVPVAL